MRFTNRSLWLAILACLAMYFYARTPLLLPSRSWVSVAFFIAVLGISTWGFWMGWRGAREQRTLWAWLAPVINGFIFVSFLAFFFLTLWRIKHM
jgi:predicted ABC-type exoprotein transport system permease subunit